MGKIVLASIGAAALFAVLSQPPHSNLPSSSSSPNGYRSSPVDRSVAVGGRDITAEALAGTRVVKASFSVGGFGTVLIIEQIQIKNIGVHEVHDFTLRCDVFGNSGTKLGSVSTILYERLRASKILTVKKLNMGLIHSQSSKVRCYVSSVSV